MRIILRITLTAAFVVYVLLLVLAAFSDHLIFQPHAPAYGERTFARAPVPVRFCRVSTRGGAIAAISMPNPAAQYTLLYSHGNGEDLGDDLPILEEFYHAGFSIFAYDYNGYGLSEGKPTEANVDADVEAAFDYLTGPLGTPPTHVISFGHSLGAAAAIHLATARPVAALVAQAPFLSPFRVVTQVPIVPWDKFDNAGAIARVHCPVLVIHGVRDEVIPFLHGQRIFELANQPKQSMWIENAHHNDVMLVDREPMLDALQRFASGLQHAN